MACYSFAEDVYLKRKKDTNKRIKQPFIDTSLGFENHWFYQSDQAIASTAHDWPNYKFISEFESEIDNLPNDVKNYFSTWKFLTDWDATERLKKQPKQELDLYAEIRKYDKFSFTKTLESMDENEVTFAVHPGFNLEYSKLSNNKKSTYLKNTRKYLEFCKSNRIKIIHLRDMLNFSETSSEMVITNLEPSLEDKFGVKPDYTVATFPNMGIPLEISPQYFEQLVNYGIYAPNFNKFNIHINNINAIGTFTEPDACFIGGLTVMEFLSKNLKY